jgi:hypothetical protein
MPAPSAAAPTGSGIVAASGFRNLRIGTKAGPPHGFGLPRHSLQPAEDVRL